VIFVSGLNAGISVRRRIEERRRIPSFSSTVDEIRVAVVNST
jgi:hypothetical protein